MAEYFMRETVIEAGRKNKALKNWNTYCSNLTMIDPEKESSYENEVAKNELLKVPYKLLNKIGTHQRRLEQFLFF